MKEKIKNIIDLLDSKKETGVWWNQDHKQEDGTITRCYKYENILLSDDGKYFFIRNEKIKIDGFKNRRKAKAIIKFIKERLYKRNEEETLKKLDETISSLERTEE